MGTPQRQRVVSRPVAWLIGFVAFTLNGLLELSYRYFHDLAENRQGTLALRLIDEMTGVYSIALLFPLVVLIARRWPWRALHVHVPAMFAFAATHTTMMWASRSLLYPVFGLGAYDYGVLWFRYPMEAARQLTGYWTFAGLVWLFDYYRRARERQVAAAELEARLAQAQIDNLRLQLQPHFLFNALNTISSAMYEDVRKADTMLAQLSDLLRRTLRPSESQYVPLSEELSLLKLYLDIMHARFGDDLTVEYAIDPAASGALVPQLILQPLVENAIRHGMDAQSSKVELSIRAQRGNGSLLLQVGDRGPGIRETRKGVGLTNTAERLEGLYGRDHEFALENGASGGLTVTMRIPYRTSA